MKIRTLSRFDSTDGLVSVIYRCDFFQQTFLETSPYLLAITIVVSLVHSVFEFLAFKNGKDLSIPGII